MVSMAIMTGVVRPALYAVPTILSFCVNSLPVIASTCSSTTIVWQPQVLNSRPSSTCALRDISNEEDERLPSICALKLIQEGYLHKSLHRDTNLFYVDDYSVYEAFVTFPTLMEFLVAPIRVHTDDLYILSGQF